MTDASLGKMPTTRLRRLTSLLSRSSGTPTDLPTGAWWTRSRMGYLRHRWSIAEGPPHVYVSFLTFAHLALFVIGTSAKHPPRPMDRELPLSFARLWPHPATVSWPLPEPVTGRDFDILYENAHRFLGD